MNLACQAETFFFRTWLTGRNPDIIRIWEILRDLDGGASAILRRSKHTMLPGALPTRALVAGTGITTSAARKLCETRAERGV